MGHSLYKNEIEYYLSINPLDEQEFPVFIETGTWIGKTVSNMIPLFEKIYSIELAEGYFQTACRKVGGNPKVKLYHGDSTYVLPTILPDINDNVLFYLDGHWSHGKSAQGEKDCPLLEEMQAINDLLVPPAIIVIDDLGLFETNPNEDWSDISVENVTQIIASRLVHQVERNDRLILYVKGKMDA